MTSLFIQLYQDEDVDILIANLLRPRGFTVVTTVESGQLGNTDAAQLEYAVEHQMAILTHNRADFEVLAREYFQAGKMHYGIVIATRHAPHEIVRRLLIILNNVTADEMQNQVRYI